MFHVEHYMCVSGGYILICSDCAEWSESQFPLHPFLHVLVVMEEWKCGLRAPHLSFGGRRPFRMHRASLRGGTEGAQGRGLRPSQGASPGEGGRKGGGHTRLRSSCVARGGARFRARLIQRGLKKHVLCFMATPTLPSLLIQTLSVRL